MREKVKNLLSTATSPMTASDVGLILGIPSEDAKRILDSLVDDGEMNYAKVHSALGFNVVTEIKLADQPRP
jgi:predicted ArsR family transcriptional regulator